MLLDEIHEQVTRKYVEMHILVVYTFTGVHKFVQEFCRKIIMSHFIFGNSQN